MPPASSNMVPLGVPAPDFNLPNIDGSMVSLSDFASSPVLLVTFVCNHCPFVVHVKDELRKLYDDYHAKGVAIVAINPNDVDAYPEDSPENMRQKARDWGWKFPYLFDESQQVAKAYKAACTPDTFIYDAQRKLAYRGQLDESRPTNGVPVTGKDVRRALDALLAGEKPDENQQPSMGCSIKWKP